MTQKGSSRPWLAEPKRVRYMAILVVFLLAFVGPWTFDLVFVPSEYTCSAPFIRLTGDYCGTPLSGIGILSAVVGEFISLVVRLVTGAATLADVGHMPLSSLLVLFPLLPFLSTLLLILPGDRSGKLRFHLAAWGLAVASTLGALLFASEPPASQLWGLWLYAGLAPSVLILEAVALALSRRSQQSK